jgi:uncharacterized protein YycO
MLLGARSDTVGNAPAGVQVRTPDYEKWSMVERVKLEVTATQESIYWDFLNDQIGKPYDKLAIFAFAFGRDWRDPKAWFCDELVLAGLERCRFFPQKLPIEVNRLTPRDAYLLTSPWTH